MKLLPLCKKRSFATQAEAEKLLYKIKNSKGYQIRTPKRTYHCPKCDQWHLTSSRFSGKDWKPKPPTKAKQLIKRIQEEAAYWKIRYGW